jgi:hypothetical protein
MTGEDGVTGVCGAAGATEGGAAGVNGTAGATEGGATGEASDWRNWR